jgi:hypothetical protein
MVLGTSAFVRIERRLLLLQEWHRLVVMSWMPLRQHLVARQSSSLIPEMLNLDLFPEAVDQPLWIAGLDLSSMSV